MNFLNNLAYFFLIRSLFWFLCGIFKVNNQPYIICMMFFHLILRHVSNQQTFIVTTLVYSKLYPLTLWPSTNTISIRYISISTRLSIQIFQRHRWPSVNHNVWAQAQIFGQSGYACLSIFHRTESESIYCLHQAAD